MSQLVKWILGILIPIVLTLCLLSFGNPQWGKWVYMWQGYVYPCYARMDSSAIAVPLRYIDYVPAISDPPDDYSGTWKTWNRDGVLISENGYLNGDYHGVYRRYYSTGELELDTKYKNGKAHDLEGKNYYQNGQLELLQGFQEDRPCGFRKEYSRSGDLLLISHYDGKALGFGHGTLIFDSKKNIDHREKYKHLLEGIEVTKEGQ